MAPTRSRLCRRRGVGRGADTPGPKKILLAELAGELGVIARNHPELEAWARPIDDYPGELVVVEVVGEHELEAAPEPLRHREPERRVDVARDQGQVVGRADSD